MPLDLSEHEEINSELNEFKTKVETVAKRYAKEHNWCGVVDRALAEIGIEPTGMQAMVEVHLTVQMPVMLHSITDLVGKSPEEINAIIAQKIAQDHIVAVPSRQDHGIRYLSTHNVLAADQIEVVDINKLEGRPRNSRGVPTGYVPVFTSDEGRVQHFVPEHAVRNGNYTYSLCGVSTRNWQTHSERDEGRFCAKCVHSANNL